MSDLSKVEFFHSGLNLYAVVGERGGDKWGVSVDFIPSATDTKLYVRFGLIHTGTTSNTVLKFFTSRAQTKYGYKNEGVIGRRLNKMVLPFADKPLNRVQFVELADQHEVWDQLESWVLSAFAAEGVSPIFGIDLAQLLRAKFEIDAATDVNFLFVTPDLLGFTKQKAEVASGGHEPDSSGDGGEEEGGDDDGEGED